MSFILLFRYIKGYAEIKVYNGFIERFVNLCTREKLLLWDIEYKADFLTAKISRKDFIKLKSIHKKSGTKIEIIKKCGLIYLYRRYKMRKLLPLSLIVSIVFMLIMNMFVWSIDINATPTVNKSTVIEVVKNHGLKIGTFSPFFDQTEASRAAINDFDGEISWLAINVKGSKAIIEVREFEKKEDISTEDEPCNYVADFDGIIIDTDTLEGEQKVFPGASVKKGALLISGITENEDGSINYHNSSGVFTARHTSIIKKNYALKNISLKCKETKSYYSLYFFGLDIPLNLTSSLCKGNNFSYTDMLNIGNKILPLGIKKIACYETESSELALNSNKIVSAINIDKFTYDEYIKLKNSRITDAEYKIKIDNGRCFIQGNYECVDFIGQKSIIMKEN